ncbi:hypothetical protein [Paenibacillus chibensis]|nr:hypothetical protein [Paenibacillus chibensis]MEC0370020.1 hypothetical protein [Paenibacillus chibensis]
MRALLVLISGAIAASLAYYVFDGTQIDVYIAYLIGCVLGHQSVKEDA